MIWMDRRAEAEARVREAKKMMARDERAPYGVAKIVKECGI